MRVLPVSEFIEIVNSLLRETLSGEAFAVEGEVSGYRVSQGQWVSFDLKDDHSLVNVFLPVWQLQVPIEDGIKVRVFGFPRVYPKYGKFSLSAERIELAGEGALRKALAMLRERLSKEGLFEPTRKRSLPRFPERIALIASRESAAYGDFLRVLNERWGGIAIDVYHVLVQGDRAPLEIVSAIQRAQSEVYDAIVMTRGGGSLEELMAFNDERVVRALYASQVPTMVAIGHERDVTLAEEVADVRGSTPTDCARRLVPDRRDVLYELVTLEERLDGSLMRQFEQWHRVLDQSVAAPQQWLVTQRLKVTHVADRMDQSAARWLEAMRERLDHQMQLLSSFDPRAVLERGYSIVRDAGGKIVKRAAGLSANTELALSFTDGDVGVIVKSTRDIPEQPKLWNL